ncbi:MAG: GAF domain-containing protein [Leptodesmis sp.]|uniref:GAF domain-containing protein n=1 Tax=Leptodesmis sp. TaxID=3100501 RepID=UPI003D0E5E85
MSDDLQARNRELEQQLRQCQQELQQAKAAQHLAESRLAAERQQFERSLQHCEAKCQQVEAALRIANDEMQALFTAMDDLILVRDAEGRCLKIFSSKNYSLLYQPADFIIGRTLHEVFPQDRADLIWNGIQQALTQGQPVKIEYSLPIQGEEIWFDTTISPLPDGTVLLVGRDVTRRRQAELALKHRAEQQAALNRVVQMIRNSLDLNTIFTTTVREVGEVLQIHQADIVRYLPERGIWLNLADYRHVPGMPSGLGLEIPDAGNSIAAQLKQGQIVEIEDYQQYDDKANRPLKAIYTYGGNWLHIPLWGEGQVWGCLSLNRAVGQKWQSAEIELARAVADQLAIAIQQANLYQQAQRELAERQRAEVALQQLNQELEQRVHQRTTQLQLALSTAGMGLWEWNMLDDTKVWSPENYALLGFCADERGQVLDLDGTVLSSHPTYPLFLERVHPEDRERLIQAQDRALEARSLYEIEYRIVFPDGTIGWRYNRGSYLFDQQGQPFKLMGICMDITQRKQAEAALRQSEEQFRAIFDNAPIAISLARVTDFHLERVNKAYRALLGYGEEALKSLTDLDLTHPEDVTQNVELVEQMKRGERSSFQMEKRLIKKNGDLIWATLTAALIRDPDGQPLYSIAMIEDITERKQVELALRHSEARFQRLVANIPGVIYQFKMTTDGVQSFPYISSFATQILGLTPAQIQQDSDSCFSRIHPDDQARLQQSILHSMQTLCPWKWEGRFIRPDGTLRWLQGMSNPERLPNGDVIWDGVIIDVSDRVQVKQALQRQFEREKLLRTVTQHIHQTMNLLDILTIVVTETRQMLQCDRVVVYRFHEDWSGSFVTESVGDRWVKLGEDTSTAWEDSYLQETQGGRYRNHESLVVPDIYAAGHSACHIEILEQFQIRAYIIVPIFVGDTLWGLLGAYQNSGSRQWQSWEVELLEQITNPLAIAIQQADLYNQLQTELAERKQAELLVKQQAIADHLIAEIAQLINQSLHLEAVLQTSLEQVRHFFKADRVFVYRFEPNWTGTIVREAISQPQFSLLGQTMADQCFVQTVADLYQQGYVTVIPDVQHSGLSLCHQEFLTQLQVRANLVAPILRGDCLWGLLIVHQCQSSHYWQPFEVDFLRQLATHIGTASQKTELYQQLAGELTQKDVLLKEIHHRVKNNLQIISSLLRMQSRQAGGEEAIAIQFQEAQNRVQSMALIHEHLYQANDLSQIDFGGYLHTLVNHLFRSYGVGEHITLAIATNGLTLTLNTAIPCGLIINELVSNSLKYAFPNGRPGHISLSLQQEQSDHPDVVGQITLVVADNGIGIPDAVDFQTTSSLGLRIVRNLVDQMKGKIVLNRDSGSLFQISFPQTRDRR